MDSLSPTFIPRIHTPIRFAEFRYGLLLAAIASVILVALLFRLQFFPGLHGDEAWVGLRALEQQGRGFFTLRGMNGYTGSLFPEIVTASFAMLSPSILSLRLPGALLNALALLLITTALWRRGRAALYFLLLMGSSLLFLFYGRVAWEVDALQNLLLSVITLSLMTLQRRERSTLQTVFPLLLAFSLGCWSHAIFAAAALSFAAAAGLVSLKWPTEHSVRILLLACVNLALQAALLGRRVVADGPFTFHALPALIVGLALVVLTCVLYVRAEGRLVPAALRMIRHPRLVRAGNGIAVLAILASLLASPVSMVTFFGTLSGAIMLERVASYMPHPAEMAGLHIRMAALVTAFLAVTVHQMRQPNARQDDLPLTLLMLWTIMFFPALMLATPGVADRYYIIPQFLFFCSIALAVDRMPARLRLLARMMLMVGFIYAQAVMVQELLRDDNRQPFEPFRYGPYVDTSQHFLRLADLAGYLERQGICRVDSRNFFIAKPMQFLMAVRGPCPSETVVRIEYCNACRGPVDWFEVTPAGGRSEP